MNQEELVRLLRQSEPKLTLKNIADSTGLHFTRVHRILAGAEMRVSEYLKLRELVVDRVLAHERRPFEQIIQMMREGGDLLTPQSLHEICEMMRRKIKIQRLFFS